MGCTCSRFEADQTSGTPRSASRSGLHQGGCARTWLIVHEHVASAWLRMIRASVGVAGVRQGRSFMQHPRAAVQSQCLSGGTAAKAEPCCPLPCVLMTVHVHSANTIRDAHASGWDPPRKQRIKHGSAAAQQLLTPQQVLELAQGVVADAFPEGSREDGSGSEGECPSAAMLAAVALVASGGRKDARYFREDVADTCIGLCQVGACTC